MPQSFWSKYFLVVVVVTALGSSTTFGARAATMPIANIALGKVIQIGVRQFVKVSSSNDFMAVQTPIKTMQEFTTADCNVLPTPSGTNYTAVGTLMDARDGKSYEIRKFADGKCWMVTNLKYGGSPDACASKTSFDGVSNKSGSAWGYGDCRNNPGSSTYGYLYNWQAAIQNASGWNGNSFQPTQPTQGICPDGWYLPKHSEFSALHTAAGSLASGFWQGGNWKGVYSGSHDTGGLSGQGSGGVYWSSTQYSTIGAYHLLFNYTSTYPTSYGYKDVGFAVRCIKN